MKTRRSPSSRAKYLFASGDDEVRAKAGDVVHTPKGHVHCWRNVGAGPGRHLEIFVPAGLERMVEEVGEPVADPDAAPAPGDPQRLLAAAPRYGIEFKLDR